MEPKNRNDRMWAFGLMVIGIATVLLAGANILEAELPDLVRRLMGLAELAALAALAFSTMKKIQNRKQIPHDEKERLKK